LSRAGLVAAAALPLLALLATGCGLVTLMHDEMLGPVSPAGRIHDAAVGRQFHATLEGVSSEAEGEPRLRPFPPDLIRRIGSPSSFHALTTGIEAFLLGASTFADRRKQSGSLPDLTRVPPLGASADEVLSALGPPDQWIRFAGGETMAYRAERERRTTLNLGIPPALGFLIPFPGASNLAYRRITKETHSEGVVLFFDGQRKLARVARAASP
jgi:hypothetical protein